MMKTEPGGPVLMNEDVRFDFCNCHARWNGGELAIGNEWIERKWRVANGVLHAVSLRDLRAGIEWIAASPTGPSPCPPGLVPDEPRTVSVSSFQGKFVAVEEPSLVIELEASGARASLKYHFQIFPGSSAIVARLTVSGEAAVAPAVLVGGDAEPTGVEVADGERIAKFVPDALENFRLSVLHLRLIRVELKDQTDVHNELVFEHEWLLQTNEVNLELAGNLFILEDTLRGNGLIFLKHAPLPHARPIRSARDFSISGNDRHCVFHCVVLGHGISPEDGVGDAFAVITYEGGRAGRIAALQNYQRQVRAFVPGRDGLLLSNTWGDRSRDARINEGFMIREIGAGARLGVDVIQIDDGWQRGRTANSADPGGVWNGFWAADADFWEPNLQRFPNGLHGVIALAKEQGMQFGLWFAPDSSGDFANWERDADKITGIHRTYGVCYIKIDGVKANTRAGGRNLDRFFSKVLGDTDGRVVFDLDVTAEIRPGYFGNLHCGPIFVENRYTDWHRYWPHHTLRNLWKLAQYVDPLRLRMEFLNNTRQTQVYENDPLAPAAYRPDYLFATTMFSNPLGWFEASNLPASYIKEVAPLVQIWKQHRERIFHGRIIPVGAPPDGTAWTGFVSMEEHSAYLLVFRELNPSAEHVIDLPASVPGAGHVTVLAGEGSVRIEDHRAVVQIPEPQRFLFAKWERE